MADQPITKKIFLSFKFSGNTPPPYWVTALTDFSGMPQKVSNGHGVEHKLGGGRIFDKFVSNVAVFGFVCTKAYRRTVINRTTGKSDTLAIFVFEKNGKRDQRFEDLFNSVMCLISEGATPIRVQTWQSLAYVNPTVEGDQEIVIASMAPTTLSNPERLADTQAMEKRQIKVFPYIVTS